MLGLYVAWCLRFLNYLDTSQTFLHHASVHQWSLTFNHFQSSMHLTVYSK